MRRAGMGEDPRAKTAGNGAQIANQMKNGSKV